MSTMFCPREMSTEREAMTEELHISVLILAVFSSSSFLWYPSYSYPLFPSHTVPPSPLMAWVLFPYLPCAPGYYYTSLWYKVFSLPSRSSVILLTCPYHRSVFLSFSHSTTPLFIVTVVLVIPTLIIHFHILHFNCRAIPAAAVRFGLSQLPILFNRNV